MNGVGDWHGEYGGHTLAFVTQEITWHQAYVA